MDRSSKRGTSGRIHKPRIRVPTHLEEAPAFLLSTGSGRVVHIPKIEWRQGDDRLRGGGRTRDREGAGHPGDGGRTWVIRGDSEFGVAGALAQRVWLGLMALYDDQQHSVGMPGVVFFTMRQLMERAHIARSKAASERVGQALVQIDALRVYVTGRPLSGPLPPTTGLGGTTYLYSFTGGERVDVPEDEVMRDQISLPGLDPPQRFRRHSSVRLSQYVTDCLAGKEGRTVEDWVFELDSAWAIRLVRLIGKRAYTKPSLVIGLDVLSPALPALTTSGDPMKRGALLRQLDRAHRDLYAHSFITDVQFDAHTDLISYRLAGRERRSLGAHEMEVADELTAIFGEARRRPEMEEFVADLGADRARACIRDWRDLGGDQGPIDRQLKRLYGLLIAARKSRGEDRARRQPLRISDRSGLG